MVCQRTKDVAACRPGQVRQAVAQDQARVVDYIWICFEISEGDAVFEEGAFLGELVLVWLMWVSLCLWISGSLYHSLSLSCVSASNRGRLCGST